MKTERIFLTPNEAAILGMGLAVIIEDLNAVKRCELANVPWTPEARKNQKEMLEAAISAAAKLEKFAGISCNLPDYNDGDEKEFLTKES